MADRDFVIEDGVLKQYVGVDREVRIPEGVSEICENVFFDENDPFGTESERYPTAITIPKSVLRVSPRAFDNCAKLSTIRVAEGNPVYHGAGNCLIETASKTLVVGCVNSVIPADGSVVRIGKDAFWGRSGLTVAIPECVTEIGEAAFIGCKNLLKITIPAGVAAIRGSTFGECDNLICIELPEGLQIIGEYAFIGCFNLSSLRIPRSVTEIGPCAFADCTGLREIVFAGMKAEWDAIKKGDYWDVATGDYVIRCSDGEIPKKVPPDPRFCEHN